MAKVVLEDVTEKFNVCGILGEFDFIRKKLTYNENTVIMKCKFDPGHRTIL